MRTLSHMPPHKQVGAIINLIFNGFFNGIVLNFSALYAVQHCIRDNSGLCPSSEITRDVPD